MYEKPDTSIQLVGLDFDKCIDPATGQIDLAVKGDLDKLNTYCEPSPSGTGVRAFAYGDIPRSGKKTDT